MRLSIDINVSIIGMPRASRAIINENAVEPFVELCIERMARENPTNRLPESPRKILAGLKLKRKNPNKEPDKHIPINAEVISLFKREIAKIVRPAITAIPVANPSSPSIRLNAFVIPVIQRTVNGNEKIP